MTDARESALAGARMRQVAASIRRQLDSRPDVVSVQGVGAVPAAYGWAILGSLDAALKTGATFDPPTVNDRGEWTAHLTIPLGRYQP